MTDGNQTLIQQNSQNKIQGKTFSNWSWLDRFILVGVLAVSGLALWQVDAVAALLSLMPLLLLYRSSSSYGRLYYDIYKEVASIWRNDFHHGIWWRADDTEGSKIARWLRKRHSAIPAVFVRIQTEIDGVMERFTLLHQTDRPYDHFYITAKGGAFASADINVRTRLVGEMIGLLNGIISQSGLKAGISHLRISNPYDQTKLAANLREGMELIIARPELFKLDEAKSKWSEWARNNARQMPVALERYRAAETLSFIVITIKRRRKWRNLRFTNDQIAETPIIELGHALIEGLRTNSNLMLQDVHSPSLPESALMARSSWDAFGIAEYYLARDSGTVPQSDADVDAIIDLHVETALEEARAASITNERKLKAITARASIKGAQEVDRLLAAWPQRCIETNGKEHYLKFDDNYIAVLRVTELPKEFRSDQIMSLHWLIKRRWTRFAFVSESVSGDAQTTMLMFKASGFENFNKAFFGRRVIRDPRQAKKSRELMGELEQMAVSTIAQMANGLITIVESDPRKLRRAVKEVKAAYLSLGFKTDQVKGSARLIDYFFSGALAANRA